MSRFRRFIGPKNDPNRSASCAKASKSPAARLISERVVEALEDNPLASFVGKLSGFLAWIHSRKPNKPAPTDDGWRTGAMWVLGRPAKKRWKDCGSLMIQFQVFQCLVHWPEAVSRITVDNWLRKIQIASPSPPDSSTLSVDQHFCRLVPAWSIPCGSSSIHVSPSKVPRADPEFQGVCWDLGVSRVLRFFWLPPTAHHGFTASFLESQA